MKMRALFLAALAAMALPAVAADKIPVADEGAIADQWTLVPGSQLLPPYPPEYAAHPEDVCLVVGYLVNADGHTSDFALLKSWTSGANSRSRAEFWNAFGDLSSRAIAQWKYTPAGAGPGKPVYTAATFVFGPPANIAETRAHCAVADLATRMAELRYDQHASRMMSRGIFSQLEVDPFIEERLRLRMQQQRENAERATMEMATQSARLVQAHPNDAD